MKTKSARWACLALLAGAVGLAAGPAMLESLAATRRAALLYLDARPAGQPVLIATFDHRPLLQVPWSTDRALLDALSRIGRVSPCILR